MNRPRPFRTYLTIPRHDPSPLEACVGPRTRRARSARENQAKKNLDKCVSAHTCAFCMP